MPIRNSRPAKSPAFVGCEGQSEVAFAQFVNDLCHRNGKAFVLRTHNANGGGPPNIVSSSIRQRNLIGKSEFCASFILADADRMTPAEPGYEKARALAEKSGFRIVASRPCIEVRIARIITGRYDGQMSKSDAVRLMQPTWPRFGEQPPTTRDLVSRISLELLAAYAESDPELRLLLETVDLLK